jgi:hypothetical protein
MTAKKPARTVSGMNVLSDIRGLLSAAPRTTPAASGTEEGSGWEAERASLEAQLKRLEGLAATRLAAVDKLEAEKNELAAKLKGHQKAVDLSPVPTKGPRATSRDIADLEARKAELEAALTSVEDLLRFKVKELARRIARVYQEAGDDRAGRDFRRISDQLEAAESFGEFVRALARD